MRKIIALFTALLALIALALPVASAADCPASALMLTEAQVNSAFRVTHPLDRNLSNVNVDLQAANGGQVVILATYTWRTGAGATQSAEITETFAPTVTNGRVYWTVLSVTANGQPASADLVAQINAHLNASWYRWISEQAPAGVVTAITISDDDLTYTYTPRASGCVPTTSSGGSSDGATTGPVSSENPAPSTGSLTITETQINDSFRVTNPWDRNLSNAHVDLQAANGGQIVLSATYSWRTGRGVESASAAETIVPTVSDGRVYWTVLSVTANGQPASADLVAQINAHLNASWYRWISEQAPAGHITSVSITDDAITYSY